MPTVLERPRKRIRSQPAPNRVRFTREDCDRMRDTGVLQGRYELINGEIISKMGQKPQHAYVITQVNGWLVRHFGANYVRIQLPINVARIDNKYNEPEPDAVALARAASAFLENAPHPADVILAIEVSDTTRSFDLNTKAMLYARAGFREYWVIDLVRRQLVIHRGPDGDTYTDVSAYAPDETASPLSNPQASIAVSELLPPR